MRSRRAGISTIIGAIFFILVVFLVFTSTIEIFQAFTGYELTVKQVNKVDATNQATVARVSALSFGGYYSNTSSFGLKSVTNTNDQPLIPVDNMNLTSGMQSWAFNRAYEVTEHDATVTNAAENVLPGLTTFTLTVFNNDTALTSIVDVKLEVNPLFSVNQTLIPAPTGWSVSLTGNTILWTNTQPFYAINSSGSYDCLPSANCLSFTWGALVPPTPGTYYHPVTLSWSVAGGVSQGSVSFSTTVVTSGPGSVAKDFVAAQPANIVPGGVQGGWDPTSASVGSQSGPGSLYFDFQPTFNGIPINGSYLINGQPSGVPEQLTAVMNFTTGFSVPWGLSPATYPACCKLNYGYSVDTLTSSPTPIVSAQVFLLIPPSPAHPNGQTALLDQFAPNQVNGFQVPYTGWTIRQILLNLGPYETGGALPAGFYRVVVSVTADLFGSAEPNSEYPANLLMHFDDVGLSVPPTGTYCADNSPTSITKSCFTPDFPAGCSGPCPLALDLNTTADQTEIRSMTLGAHLALTSDTAVPATAVLYLADFSRGPAEPRWVDVGVATLSPTADVNISLPTSSAFQFVFENTTVVNGKPLDMDQVQARVYLLSNDTFTATATLSVVMTTWSQKGAVISVYNGSTTPIHLVDVFISGPGGISNENVNYWVAAGSTQQVEVPDFVWLGGQTYTATVLTDKGLSLDGLFSSP